MSQWEDRPDGPCEWFLTADVFVRTVTDDHGRPLGWPVRLCQTLYEQHPPTGLREIMVDDIAFEVGDVVYDASDGSYNVILKAIEGDWVLGSDWVDVFRNWSWAPQFTWDNPPESIPSISYMLVHASGGYFAINPADFAFLSRRGMPGMVVVRDFDGNEVNPVSD